MKYKLKEIFDLHMGKTPSRNNAEYWNSNEYKWISIADLSKTGKYIRDTKEHLSKQAIDESGIKLIPANTVIMSFKLSIGKTAITAEDMYSNEAIMAFHDKHVVDILPEYLFYMFKFKNWDEGSNKAVMGKTLNKATLSDVEIDVCSIEKQREIVDILNKIMNILENRDNEIVLLDNLIKARFVEMFGNARENPKGYKMVLFNDIVEYMGDIGSNGANTATPKDEIDKNTYEVFELENGVPTYGYDLAQAVKDGYLVDYVSVESKLKFIEQGIVYDELSEEDRKAYEKTFEDEHGELPEAIGSSALNTWIFNEDTIKHVLNILMRDGIKIDYGQKLGKTIIFAKNHAHAEKILEIFNKEYPHLTNYANVIDNYMTYAQSAIDEFSDPKKLPQIAISVDMLDTGIDVPDVLNLVFFKKVMSKAKFWQMIGRGTRLFQGLLDGEDKEKFYIFDFCGNFEFFRMNKGKATANMMALQGAIFNLKFEISYKLQDIEYQIDRLVAYRKALVMQMSEKVRELPRDNFAVRQHLKYVDLYSSEENYNALTYEDTLIVKEEVAPLILSDGDEASAVRFDALMYGIELAYLAGKKYSRARSDLHKKIAGIASVANIPEIQAQTDLINKVLNTDYVDTAGINEFEEIREKLRNLMKYLPNSSIRYDTNFTDEVLSTEWNESELENDDLKNYKAKAEYYIRQHQDNIAIAKLKRNKPLTSTDIAMLEEVLWSEVGTKQDYEQEFGEKPLGEFVREIVGLDMNAAKEAFSEYLTNASLDSRQIYFVNQIVEYIVHNGMMKDLSVLQESPFTDRGSVVEIFTDLSVWMGIRKVIDMINANAVA